MDGHLCFNDKPAKIFRSKRVLLQKFGFLGIGNLCLKDKTAENISFKISNLDSGRQPNHVSRTKPAKIFRLKPPKARINERF